MFSEKSSRRRAFYYILSAALLIQSMGFGASETSIKLINSTSTSVTLQCQPGMWQTDSLQIDGQLNLRYRFADSEFEGETGSPGIPTSSTIIGVPVGADVRLTILSSNFREVPNVRLAPIPTIEYEDKLPKSIYFADQGAYASNDALPAALAKVAKDGYYRRQRLVSVQFYPLQAIPGENRVRLYENITVRLDFVGGEKTRTTSAAKTISAEEDLYDGLVLNYQQAKAWRVPRARSLAKPQSIFAVGDRYKIPTRYEGFYKVTGSFLQSNGVSLGEIKPDNIKIFNNGGRELPQSLEAARDDSLIENAIIVVDGGDNAFNENDYVLFYAKPISGWSYSSTSNTYSHYINHYTTENIYWISWSDDRPGKRIQTKAALPEGSGDRQATFESRNFSELEQNNIHNSGLNWYGPSFTKTVSEHQFNLNLQGASESDTAYFKIKFFGYSSTTHRFNITVNDISLGSSLFSGYSERTFENATPGVLKAGLNTIKIEYIAQDDVSLAYIDWLEVDYRARFTADENKLFFCAPKSASPASYELTGFESNTIDVYDISDISNIRKLSNTNILNQSVTFADSCDPVVPKKYFATTPATYYSPTQLIKDSPSDLRSSTNGADYIIIYHSDFGEQARQLAEHRRQFDGLNVSTVNIQDVFDEFSWGLYDAVAIRDFLRYAFYNWNPEPRTVLLFGDGDFDYKNIISDMDKNWIPPFETSEHSETWSRAMDDWYTFIVGNDVINDISIGRFTVRTPTEAQNLVDKIIAYDSSPVYGDWKNTVTVVADDEYVSGGESSRWDLVHVQDAEDLSESYIPQTFNLKKIYLMEYPAVKSASISGIRKPAAGEDLLNQINRGTLLINYVGHGHETLWSHERILTSASEIDKIQNQGKLPMWIAATCAWGRYDMIEGQSMSEELLAFKDRGAIAILTASREAFAAPNAQLNKLFFSYLFQKQGNGWEIGATTPIGEALMKAKIAHTGSAENDQKYHIFGDPAMKLALPKYEAQITSITPDSVKALSKIRVKGRIMKDHTPWTDFKGKIFLTAFDSKKDQSYTTEEDLTVHYLLPGNAIFRGPALVENGQFDMNFIVPKDITYGGNFGRVSLYFWNESVNGTGKRDSLSVGGTAAAISDQVGPEIRLSIKGFPFGSEAVVGQSPALYAEIEDSVSGVNITGEIGHTISLTLDGNLVNKKDATEFFVFNEGSWSTGTFEFPLTNFAATGADDGSNSSQGLTAGDHTIEVKAWDNFNNSSTAILNFTVIDEDKLVLTKVMNYPNPFSSSTAFTFIANRDAEVTIKIYTVAGRLVKTLKDIYVETGNFNQIQWFGQDDDDHDMANGVYLYKVIAKSIMDSNMKADFIGRVVIMR